MDRCRDPETPGSRHGLLRAPRGCCGVSISKFRQVGATEMWEDNDSCIMMSENPANPERTRDSVSVMRPSTLRAVTTPRTTMLTFECIICGSSRWPRQVAKVRRTAECGRCADQKPSVSSPCQTSAIHVGDTCSFFKPSSLS